MSTEQKPTYLKPLDVYAMLRKECKAAGSQSKFAEKHGVSAAYVSDVLNGRQDPGPALLTALGLRRVVLYVRAGAK